MTAYALSTNPNVQFNSNVINQDQFIIDTTSAGNVTFQQLGADVIIRDNLGHTATLHGVLLQDFQQGLNITTADGSLVRIGDNTFLPGAPGFGDNDTNDVTGSALGDYIMGLGGNDSLNGAGGADRIYGNQGADTIFTSVAAAGNDSVYGGQGNDTIDYGGLLPGHTAATTGNLLIYGNLGDDTITGGGGSDTIYGGQGNDVIVDLAQPATT